VDDHFAKALGKTWAVLQAKRNNTPPPPPAYSLPPPPPPSYNSATGGATLSIVPVTRTGAPTGDATGTTSVPPATITRVMPTSTPPSDREDQLPVYTYQHKLYNRMTSDKSKSPTPPSVSIIKHTPGSPSAVASPRTSPSLLVKSMPSDMDTS